LNECREAILKWDKMFETTPVLLARAPFESGKAATGGIVTYQCVKPRGDPNQESSWFVPEIRAGGTCTRRLVPARFSIPTLGVHRLISEPLRKCVGRRDRRHSVVAFRL
jgi:hypothetical protein